MKLIKQPAAIIKIVTLAILALCGIRPLTMAQAAQTGTLCVQKFYDANANGKWDAGEPYIDGWAFEIFSHSTYLEGLTPECFDLRCRSYRVTEGTPLEDNWIATTRTTVKAWVYPDETKTVCFGNVCLGAGGGYTLGYWSNKNGQKLEEDADFAALTALHLRNGDGSDRDFTADLATKKSDLHDWLLDANAVNMSNMLSAQLAAMTLNVQQGFVSGSALVHASDCGNTGVDDQFITINDLMAAADAALAADGYAIDGDPNRDTQECLKDALDDANNNLNFVQAQPCSFSFGE
jgi:hypothetical protein